MMRMRMRIRSHDVGWKVIVDGCRENHTVVSELRGFRHLEICWVVGGQRILVSWFLGKRREERRGGREGKERKGKGEGVIM